MDNKARLVDAGIDYIRITSQEAAAKLRMLRYYDRVVKDDHKLGYDEVKGGAFGFWGYRTRHALYGTKKEWAMLQVSGYEAKRAVTVEHPATQCTRLDLQLTWYVGEGNVARYIRDAYNAACSTVRPAAKHMKITLIEQRHQPQTLYLGSRASDIFFRIYDKEAESGKEEYKGCVRFELELKGRASKALWAKLVAGETNLAKMLGMVIAMLKERGVLVPNEDIEEADIIRFKKAPTLQERTIGWLARQVAPTVAKIAQSHGWIFPFSVLFSDACTDWDRSRIIKTLSNVWGS